MTERSCCQGNWRSRFFAKLGRCPRCMRLSLAITVGAWLLVAGAPTLGLESVPGSGMLVWAVALAASVLTVAHFAVFLTRGRVATEMQTEDGTMEPVVVEYSLGRRAFLARLPLSVAALGGVLLGRTMPIEAAPGSWCVHTVTFVIDPRFCKKIAVGSQVCLPCDAGGCLSGGSNGIVGCSKNACYFQATAGFGCGTCSGSAVSLRGWNCA